MDYLFCPTSCFCEKSKCAPVEGNIVPELIGTNNSDKQIWELDDICKLLKINKNFFRLLIFEKKTLYYGYAMQEGSGSLLSSDRQEDL